MTWVAWRQHRTAVLSSLGVVLLIGLGLVALRLAATSSIRELGLTGCLRDGYFDPGCPAGAQSVLEDRFSSLLSWLPQFLIVLPVLLGVLVGGPLVAREFEQRTQLFTLTQSVGRARWWAVEAAVVGMPVTVALLTLGLVVGWAREPLYVLSPTRLESGWFETTGLVMGGYFLLAFCAAALLGLVLRNTVGAIALGVVAYLVLVPALSMLRPHVLDTTVVSAAPGTVMTDTYVPAGSRVLDVGYRSAAGEPVSPRYDQCGEPFNPATCAEEQGAVSERAEFIPPSHYWPLQLIETGLAIALAAVALLLGLLQVRRRVI
ncbi:hypothetical protein E4P41_19290 [Geodermatophilus sp. DF01-2]|uniref:hypothetical protein n=1 Tax=Geodermatophilus sp. DF01-2 TaxID=2559610 RepID=UPI001073A2A2|nr:hypothetical protein [Geodermatophilus sp. DF01_2]TFV54272.1 hypothetical protein E4P41_19290 [Geodermatophilus sp. DF01_2]